VKATVSIIALALLSTAATAQESRGREPRELGREQRVPGAVSVPAGLCRLWIEGVPASQQPAPTDCANAIRNRPPNAAVIYGAPVRSGAMEMEPFARQPGKLPIRQLNAGSRSGDREAARDEPRGRSGDTAAKPARRKPEKPQ